MINRHPGLNARPALLARLDHDGRQPVAGHRRIPHRERLPASRRVRPELRQHQPASGDLLLECAVLSRVGDPDPGPDHRDRPAADIQRGPVRGRVDAASQPRDHRHPPVHQRPGNLARQRDARHGSRPGSDDRYTRIVYQHGPPGEDDRRCLVDAAQSLRVILIQN
jgi:hypothetical protein